MKAKMNAHDFFASFRLDESNEENCSWEDVIPTEF